MHQPDFTRFAQRLVAWQQVYGRQGLPWQQTQDPYRVWLSEVMLQQTQVATVIDYYNRFLSKFPTLHALANAHEDEVLALWSGLGYYSRARNLYRCAQTIVTQYGGEFPKHSTDLAGLPGIGPSTAAAIASFCFLEHISIFDGNVQRVLARWLGFDEDLSKTTSQKALYAQAQTLVQYLPAAEMPRYTQGLMDLGATVCTVKNPSCLVCPMTRDCMAYQTQRTAELPHKTKRTKRQTEQWTVLIAQRPDHHIYLIQRPEKGIWAKLRCFPMFANPQELQAWLGSDFDIHTQAHPLPTLTHNLTHKELTLHAYVVQTPSDWIPPPSSLPIGGWYAPDKAQELALPVPVQQWLTAIQ
ncbi:MAG: A/G-specific adenine glycosylase [Pseudomonadota bacterium]|jgi:A/G-specific adenine glycosylase